MDTLNSLKTAVLNRVQNNRASGESNSSLGQFVSQRADQVMGRSEFETGGLGAVSKPEAGQLNNYDPKLRTKNSEPLTGTDKDGRLKDLQGFSQRDDDDKNTYNDTQRCGATSLTAAAYHADGGKGLNQLLDASEAYNANHGVAPEPADQKELQALRERINSGKMTKGDLSQVAERVHLTMGLADLTGSRAGAGVSQGGMNAFLNSPEAAKFKGTLDSNGTSIEPVDVQNKGQFNHWVARLGTGHGSPAIYDPESIKGPDGKLNQVTEDPAAVERYTKSSRQVRAH
ncbi:MAG: hypothetical protein U0931_17995 [Vulcanimicrobiota bacterium]